MLMREAPWKWVVFASSSDSPTICCLDINCPVPKKQKKLFDGMEGAGQTGHVPERDENNSWIIKSYWNKKKRNDDDEPTRKCCPRVYIRSSAGEFVRECCLCEPAAQEHTEICFGWTPEILRHLYHLIALEQLFSNTFLRFFFFFLLFETLAAVYEIVYISVRQSYYSIFIAVFIQCQSPCLLYYYYYHFSFFLSFSNSRPRWDWTPPP